VSGDDAKSAGFLPRCEKSATNSRALSLNRRAGLTDRRLPASRAHRAQKPTILEDLAAVGTGMPVTALLNVAASAMGFELLKGCKRGTPRVPDWSKMSRADGLGIGEE
jgi:hypothetical protein